MAAPVDVNVEFLYCTNKTNCKNREETKKFLDQNYSFVVMAFEQYMDMNDRDNPVKQRFTSFADTFSRQRYLLNYLSLNTYSI
jgi:sulfatase maturation enzyme AslB (radical SAM superfamily)